MSDKDDTIDMIEDEVRETSSGENDETNDAMGHVKSKIKKLKGKKKNGGGSEDEAEEELVLPEEGGEFMCGVVEGFYGRPWTTGQRKELFRRMKSMGMNTYLYGPKDDYKHRLYWRDLYSKDETELLKLLIEAADEQEILFIYAISPGLDMAFASTKEIESLKSKLLQVQSLGCKAFALLFDDIDPILCAADKETYQSAASAQASVTNQMYEILNGPRFLFCPTEYCNSMAIPDVRNSRYLKTIGKELDKRISIMWTGPKVVSKSISLESIQQLTKIVRRRVIIWDNIHANDYDPKRVFLGPYKGRSTELIPHLAGVLTNPNCEFESNFIAMHTLASWWKSYDKQKNLEVVLPEKTSEETEKKSDVEMAETVDEEKTKSDKEEKEKSDEQEEKVKEDEKSKEETEKEQNEEQPPSPVRDVEENDPNQGGGASAMSSGVSSLIGSDDSETDSDYSSHDEFFPTRRSSLPFDHGSYDPEQSLKEAIKSWLPLFSTSRMPLGKPIARSGPPLGMPQFDVTLVSNAPMGPSSSTTSALPSDPILSTASPQYEYGSPSHSPNIVVKTDSLKPEKEKGGEGEKGEIEGEGHVAPKPQEGAEDSDIEMVSTTPHLNSPGTPGTPNKPDTDPEKIMGDVDMNLPGDGDKEKLETMQTGDVENVTMKRCESNVQMDTEEEEPMQYEADHDSDVSMATTASVGEEKKENHKEEIEDKDAMAPSPPSSVDMTSPPHPPPSVPQSPQHTTEEPTQQPTYEHPETGSNLFKIETMNQEDVELAVELFYLPYEHGKIGRKMLEEFVWLQRNIHKAVAPPNAPKSAKTDHLDKAVEWMERAIQFEESCISIRRMCNKLTTCSNRALLYDLFPYFWDMKGVVSMLSSYIKWMGQFYLRHQPAKSPEPSETSPNQSKPASPAQSSEKPPTAKNFPPFPANPAAAWLGPDPEPWAFRGGLSGEFQRLLPITMANDLFCQAIPCSPQTSNTTYVIRPFLATDEKSVYKICLTTGNDGTDFSDDFTGYEDLPGERLVGGLLTLSPEFCFVVEDELGICGYLVGTSDAKSFWKKYSVAFLPEVKEKYSLPKEDETEGVTGVKIGEEVRRLLEEIRSDEPPDSYAVDSLHSSHPAYMQIAVHRRVNDPSIAKSMTVCMLSALKSHGVHGVHTTVRSSDCYMPDLYARLGFHEIRPSDPSPVPHVTSDLSTYKDDTTIIFGRTF